MGNSSNLCANNSLRDFSILKALNISINYSKAPRISEVIWIPPSRGWFKVNSDGATHGAHGHAGGGALFRNHRGKFLAFFVVYFEIQDALFVEPHSAILTIELAFQKDWRSIWLECDSALVVDIFNDKAKPSWKLLNRWMVCKNLLSSMSFKVSHIYRKGNTSDDKLANYAISTRSFSWWNSIPIFTHKDCSRNELGPPNYRFKHL
ncbi:hypothetical protein Lal_00029954 [Lupinus albus]|nr:hypothetical protein Lal_00029954 [Lupinus albus]